MRLYAGTTKQFIKDSTLNKISEILKQAFFDYYRYNPSPNEINSWQNSLRAMSQILQYSELFDNGITLEYQLPLTSKRLDCMVCGHDQNGKQNAVVVELKQWQKAFESECENEVLTHLGGGLRETLHPSVQVSQYRTYLQDTHTAFYGANMVNLFSCSYLHNYRFESNDALLHPKFTETITTSPIFSADSAEDLSGYLHQKLSKGNGEEVLTRIEKSEYKPSKKLMQHVSGVIQGKPEYTLLDEQLIVYDKVLACAKKAASKKEEKSIILIKGGPGTGKSVIAINLMAALLKKNHNTHYATGSKAFTETLRAVIGARGSSQFKYFNSYTTAKNNEVDVLICDEAHRIRKTSNNRFTPAAKRSGKDQIEELLNASKVSVFFIDDKQVVRPDEIGSVDYIKAYAERENIPVEDFELEAQFRCSGSDGFVNWINNTLGIQRTANVLWDTRNETYDLKIFSDPEEMDQAIREKAAQGFSARMTAGFCWEWSKPKPDGTLVDDVVIGNYKRPWNANPDAGRLAKGIPKASLWAYDPEGIDQVGCIYTAQGFEFDYAGVIIGQDLKYDWDKNDWTGLKEHSHDTMVKRSKDRFLELTKNTYRVLLSRGIKGCYIYFADKDTERFFRSRME